MFWFLTVVYCLTCAADVFITVATLGLTAGLTAEANPLMRFALGYGWVGGLLIQVPGLVLLLLLVWLVARSSRDREWFMAVGVCVRTLVVTWNAVLLCLCKGLL